MTSVLSIGSNLGDRLAALQAAVDLLEPTAVSAVYETAPVGGPAQDDYLNAVVVCAWDATGAWDRAQQAEQAQGRERAVRWGPRTLDVDVIVADGAVPPGLVLPHPRAHQRAFVLVPWLDLDPAAVLPGHGRIEDLLGTIDATGVHKRDDLLLVPHGHASKES